MTSPVVAGIWQARRFGRKDPDRQAELIATMKAVLLAAGMGKRLGARGRELPKCQLAFGGQTLLERHIRALRKLGCRPIIIVVGYKKELVEQDVAARFPDLSLACLFNSHANVAGKRLPRSSEADILFVENPAFHHGNLLSLLGTHKLVEGQQFILMDADVLCDERILQRLFESPQPNCFLLDRNFPEGEEETLAAANAGRVIRFERGLQARNFDVVGESVGFFKFSAEASRLLFQQMQEYVSHGEVDAQYDDALRDILLKVVFGYEDITGLPWIEIDFEEDVRRAETEILPRLEQAAQPCTAPEQHEPLPRP